MAVKNNVNNNACFAGYININACIPCQVNMTFSRLNIVFSMHLHSA